MKKLTILTLALVVLASCAHKNESGEKAQKIYQNSMEDSVRNIIAEIDSCNDVASSLADKINGLLPEFRAVDNSREVEGYTIFQGWEKRYPLQSTGLVARLSNSRQLELVGVLKGGEFDQIRVNVPSASAVSSVVPFDQALNYRQNGLNTVMFTGKEADEIARLIADNELNPITVSFLKEGKVAGTWKMPNDYAKMVSMTYILYSSNKEMQALTQRSLLLTEKLKLLRRHQETDFFKEMRKKRPR